MRTFKGTIQIDYEALVDDIEIQRRFNNNVSEVAIAFNDEAYRTMFLKEAKIYKIVKDKDGNNIAVELSEYGKLNLEKNDDGKIHIANNGINNSLDDAVKNAAQHADGDTIHYLVYFPEASNPVSELLVAGYQKYLEGDTLGLTNATTVNTAIMNTYGIDGLHVDGHSRGSLTTENAMGSLANNPSNQGVLIGTTINYFGPAQNVSNSDATLAYLQNRDSVTDTNIQNSMVINYEARVGDPISSIVGLNASTGGSIPDGSNLVWEMVRAVTGQPNTTHNLYFVDYGNFIPNLREKDRQDLIDDFNNGSQENILQPIRTYPNNEIGGTQ